MTDKPALPSQDEIVAKVASERNLSPGEALGIMRDLARVEEGGHAQQSRHLSHAQIREKWKIGRAKMNEILEEHGGDLDRLRAAASKRAMILAALFQDSIMEDVMDEEKMRKMSTKDKGTVLRALADSGVIFQDGHAPKDGANAVGKLMEMLVEEKMKLAVVVGGNAG